MSADPGITGTDFVSGPDHRPRTLGRLLRRDARPAPLVPTCPSATYAEFETGNLTLNIADPVKMGIGEFAPNHNHVALHVEDMRGRARRAGGSAA